MVSEEVGVADSLRDVRGNRNDPVYAGLCIAEFDDRHRRSTSIFSCFASHPGQMSRLAFPSSSFTSHPERYSGGNLHNSPPLLSHVCPAALSFDGYVTPWIFQTIPSPALDDGIVVVQIVELDLHHLNVRIVGENLLQYLVYSTSDLLSLLSACRRLLSKLYRIPPGAVMLFPRKCCISHTNVVSFPQKHLSAGKGAPHHGTH